MIEELVSNLTFRILRKDKFFKYKDIVLSIEETEITNAMYYTRYVRISIAPPLYMRNDFNDVYSVVYEKRGYDQSREARINAANKLAREVITKLLPKLDFKLKQELYNYEVEKTLEVLD